MVGTAGTILMYCPAELRHRHYRDIVLPGIQILPEGGYAVAEIGYITREYAIVRSLVEMRIPSIRFRECHFHSHIHLYELRDLPQRISQWRRRIYRSRRRPVIPDIGLL